MLDDDTRAGLGFIGKFVGVLVLLVLAYAALTWVFHGLDAGGIAGAGGTRRFGG